MKRSLPHCVLEPILLETDAVCPQWVTQGDKQKQMEVKALKGLSETAP